MSQLALPLQLADHAVFSSFLADGNEEPVAALTEIATRRRGPGCWLWGSLGGGKSHLLQAVCELAGDASVYLPISTLAEAGPAMLDGLASREVICVDDIDAVFGRSDWETALFGLCNRLFDADRPLVVSAACSSRAADIALPDLASRLRQLPVYQLQELSDAERIAALQLRARHRGLELPDDAAKYLLRRSRRDMGSLYAFLDRLDAAALRAKRRVTLPLVRDVLAEGE